MPKYKDYPGVGVLEIPDGASATEELAIYEAAKARAEAARQPERQSPGIGTQIGAVFAGIPAGIIKGTSSAVEGLGAIAGDEDLKQIGRGLRENSVSRYFTDVPQQQQGTMGREIGELAGQFVPMLIPGVAAESAGIGALGRMGVSGAANAALSAGQASEEAYRQGATPEQQNTAARWAGPIGGALGMIPTERLLGRLAPTAGRESLAAIEAIATEGLGKRVARAGVTGAIEGAANAGQQLTQNLVENLTYNANQRLDEGLMDATGVGAATGAGLDLLIGAMGKRAALARRISADAKRMERTPPELTPGPLNSTDIRNKEVKFTPGVLDAAAKELYDKPYLDLPEREQEILINAIERRKVADVFDPNQPLMQTDTRGYGYGAAPQKKSAQRMAAVQEPMGDTVPYQPISTSGTGFAPVPEMLRPETTPMQPTAPEQPRPRIFQGSVPSLQEVMSQTQVRPVEPAAGPALVARDVQQAEMAQRQQSEALAQRQQAEAPPPSLIEQVAEQPVAKRPGPPINLESPPIDRTKLPPVVLTEQGTFAVPSAMRPRYSGEAPPVSPAPTLVELAQAKAKADMEYAAEAERLRAAEAASQRRYAERLNEKRDPMGIHARYGDEGALPPLPVPETVAPMVQPEQLKPSLWGISKKYSLGDGSAQPTLPGQPENATHYLAPEIQKELRRLGVNDLLAVRLADNLLNSEYMPTDAKASYKDRVVEMALKAHSDPKELIANLNHESVHAMQEMGLFTPEEWQLLRKNFDPNRVLSPEDQDRYNQLYGDNPVLLQEEAVARGIERYVAGRMDLPPDAAAVVGQKLGILEKMGGVFTRQQTAQDVIDRFRSGDIGRRPTKENYGNFKLTNEPGSATPPIGQAAQDGQTAPVKINSIRDLIPEEAEVEVGGSAPVKFSLPTKWDSPAQQKAYEQHVGKPAPDKTSFERIKAGLRSDWLSLLHQQAIDRRSGIDRNERTLNAGEHKPVDLSADAAVRAADNARTLLGNSIDMGPIQYTGNDAMDGHFKILDDPRLSLSSIVTDAKAKGAWEPFVLHQMAEQYRAMPAEVQARENAKGKWNQQALAAADQAGRRPEVQELRKRWQEANNHWIDTYQKSGMITPQMAQQWKQSNHVSLYRLDADGNMVNTMGGGSLGNKRNLARREGSEALSNEIVSNTIRNHVQLADLAMKNVAATRAVVDAANLGMAKHTKTAGPNTVKIMVDGRPQHFEISDPVTFASMSSSGINPQGMFGWTAPGRKASALLRDTVTITPWYMARNLMRDSIESWARGYKDYPFQNILSDAKKAFTDSPEKRKLREMGVIGHESLANSESGEYEVAKKMLGEIEKSKNPFVTLRDKLQELSASSEAVNRIGVYESVKKRGGSDAEAAQAARELVNFGRHGASEVIQVMNSFIPFQNARWQGTDVLTRSVLGKGVGGKEMQRRMMARSAQMSAASAAYVLMASQTEGWQSATPEERDNHWFIPIDSLPGVKKGAAFKIPIPQEFGVVTKILPERLVAYLQGQDRGEEIVSSMKRAVMNNLGASITPQIMKPVAEIAANHDTFRDRPIETEAMQKLEPWARQDSYTSEVAKRVGDATDVSPLQIDHLLKGYFGSVGTFALALSDAMMSKGSAPEMRVSEPWTIPGVGSLFQRPDGPKQIIDYYDLKTLADQAANTLRAETATGEPPPKDRVERQAKRAAVSKALSGIDAEMTKLRKYRASVQADPNMSGALKRDTLTHIREMENKLAGSTAPLRKVME